MTLDFKTRSTDEDEITFGPWMARFCWSGAGFGGWLRLLAAGRFAIDRPFVPLVPVIALASIRSSALHFLQRLLYGRRIAQTEIVHDPLFIIGHWRTGTTFLHELLCLDPRHTFPTTYQCLAPNCFIIAHRLGIAKLRPSLPARRIIDQMALGWERPNEDEFALCLMGAPSPYLSIAFPHAGKLLERLDFERLSPAEIARWKKCFLRFLKQITYLTPKRIVLKSPPHTCRIRILRELFPEARFVRLVRNPYDVFVSTRHLWRTVYTAHGLQRPPYPSLEEDVFEAYLQMEATFERTRELIPAGRLVEVRYEDLVHDPTAELRRIYEQLQLGEFDKVLPALEQRLAEIREYQTNRYEFSSCLKAEIARRWEWLFRKQGYPGSSSGSRANASGHSTELPRP